MSLWLTLALTFLVAGAISAAVVVFVSGPHQPDRGATRTLRPHETHRAAARARRTATFL